MMLVIAIIISFFAIARGFTNTRQTDRQKFDRLNSFLMDTIRSENTNLFLGKMPQWNGKITARTTFIFQSGTGFLRQYYDSAGVLLSTDVTVAPILSDKMNQIVKLVWTGSSTPSENGSGTIGELRLMSTGITLSGAGLARVTPFFEIWTQYGSYTGVISIDRRVGRIEMR